MAEREGFELREVTLCISKLLMHKEADVPSNPPKSPYLPPDSPPNQLQGQRIRTAHTGPDALSEVPQWHPDVVLLDVGLPALDGFEVALCVRADRRIRATRLIAISGYTQDTDIARAREAGFDAHLAKPLEFPELMKLMTVST